MIALAFGWAADPLAEQCRRLGITPPENDVKQAQKDADAVCRLAVRGILTAAERSKAYRRITKSLLSDRGSHE